MAGRFMAFGITACVPFVLVRFLSQHEFGTYKQAFLISSTLYLISQFGFATSLFYFLPKAQQGSRYVCNAIIFLTCLGALCASVLALAAKPIAARLNNPGLSEYLPWIGLYTAFFMVSVILEIVMICRAQYVYASATYALSDALKAVCFLIPVCLGWGLRGLFIGAVLAMAARGAVMVVYFKREFGAAMTPDLRLFRSQLQYAVPFGAAVLVSILERNYHQYFVSSHFDASTFAIYAAGCLQIPFIDFVAVPSGDVMMVKMREAFANGNNGAILAIWHDTTRKLAALFFPMVALSIIVARELIVTLYTSAYEASVPIFIAWSFAIVFAAILTDGVMRVYAQTRFLLIVNLVKLGLTAALVGLFVQSFHLVGAVTITLATTLVAKAVALARMKHLMKIRWPELLPWSKLGVITLFAIVAGLPAILVKNSFHAVPLVALLVAGLAYVVSYGALALGSGLVALPNLSAMWSWRRKAGESVGESA